MTIFIRDEVLADMDDAPLNAANKLLNRVNEQAAEIKRLRNVAEAAITLVEKLRLTWGEIDDLDGVANVAQTQLVNAVKALPAIAGQPHVHDPIECGCELTQADVPVEPANR